MSKSVVVLIAAALAWPPNAHAQGYSVVGGGSSHGDAQPAANTTRGTATPSDNGTAATVGSAGSTSQANAPPAQSDTGADGTATVAPASGRNAPRAVVAPAGETPSGRHPWDYAGLTPGAAGARIPGLSRSEARRAGDRAVVAWPGFQVTPTGSRIFVATTRPVVVSGPVHTPGRWTYVLGHAYIPLRNNRRPLETEAFETPVDRAYVRQHGSNVELVIETRADAQPQMTQQNAGAGGLSYVFLDFQRWTPPNHVPQILRRGPAGRQQGIRLSPGQLPSGTDTTPPGVDDERPPPVER